MNKRTGHKLFFLIIFWLGMVQPAAALDTLVHDSFETPGNLSGWTATNVLLGTKANAAYDGVQFADFQPNVTFATLSRTLDLSAYQEADSTTLTFAWQDDSNWETADTFVAEIDSAGTGSWHRIYSHAGNQNTYYVVSIDLDSVSSLSASYGIRFRFIWDNNGGTEGAFLDSVVVTGVQAQAPVLTGLSAAANIGAVQSADGTRQVNITYEASDAERDSVYITAEYRIGAGGWAAIPAAYLSGDTGRIGAGSPSLDRTITWDVDGHLPATEASDYQVRLTADDESGGANDSTTTAMAAADLAIDTRNPLNLAGLTAVGATATACTLSWTPASDGNFDHYEVWLGTDLTNVAARNIAATEWDDGDDAALALAATGTTVVTGLAPVTKFYFMIWAVDAYGNDTTVAADSVTTQTTPSPVVTGWDPSLYVNVSQSDGSHVVIGYEVSDTDDGTVTVSAQYLVQGGTWQDLNTDITGDTGSIATSATADRTITWDVLTAFGAGTDTTVSVRVMADDGTYRDTTSSAAFNIDTRTPQGLTSLATADSTASSVTLSWTAATETNFNHYEIWYGTDPANVAARSGASEWDEDNDGDLGSDSAGNTVITGLYPDTKYFFRIWAVDDFGYESAAGPDSIETQPVDPPFIESFEAPTNLGDWVTSNAAINYGTVFSGTQAAELEGVGTGGYIYRDFDLEVFAGASDMELYFAFADVGNLEPVDSFVVEVDRENGGSWQRLYSHGGPRAVYTGVTLDLDQAGELTDDYRIRFRFIYDLDGNNEGYVVDSVVLNGSLPTLPTLTGLNAAANITASQTTDGTGVVNIHFETGDAQADSVYMTADYRVNGDPWTAIPAGYLGGDAGRIDGNNTATDRLITWDVVSHLPGVEATDYQVRLTANDELGGPYDSTTTAMAAADLVLDTRAPLSLASLAVAGSTATACTLSWVSALDVNFDHYEIWLGSSLADVLGRGGGAVEWDNDDDPGLGDQNATGTNITGLGPVTKYYFRIWAVDEKGNESSSGPDSVTTLSTPSPAISGWDPALSVQGTQFNADSVRIGYEVSDVDNDTVTVSAQYLVAGGSWQDLTANINGDTGRIATSATANDTILWDILTLFGSGTDTTVTVRIMADDGTYQDTSTSVAFNVDTRAPQGLGSFIHTDSTYNSVSFGWTAATETNFMHYEIWYGTSLADVVSRSGSAAAWNGSNDTYLNIRTTTTTTVTGLDPDTKYYFKIWAVDDFDREMTVAADSCVTQNGTLPFTDDFETSLNNWTLSSGTDVTRNNTGAYSGTWAVLLDNQTSWMYTSLDLALYEGATDVTARFAFRDNNALESADSFWVDVYDGTWKRAYAHGDDQDAWTVITLDLDSLATLTTDVRLRFTLESDNAADEYMVDSVHVSGTVPTAPTLTGLSGAAYITAAQQKDGSGRVRIDYETGDVEADSVHITAAYRRNGDIWTTIPMAYLSGDTGRVDGNDTATDRQIVWDVVSHLGAVNGTDYQVRLTANDQLGGLYSTTTTAMAAANLILDTQAPDNDLTLTATPLDQTRIALAWTPGSIDAGDADSVGIWYKTANYPDSAGDPAATRLTGFTLAASKDTLEGLAENTLFYFVLCVRDTFGNWTDTITNASDSAWTWPTSTVTVTATDLTPTFTPGDTVAAVRLAFSGLTGDPRIPQINIKRTSTATDADVPRVFIYEDGDQDDIIDDKSDFISTNIVVSGSTSVVSLQNTILSATSNWLVAFAIAPDASVTSQAGMAINGTDIYGMDWTTVTFGGITTGTYPLPVELAFFYGTAGPQGITLQWRTESEKDNLKWEILRATAGQDWFTLIHEECKEAGEQTTPFATDYSFTDTDVRTGETYYYILVDVAVDGERTRHGPVRVEATAAVPDPDLVSFTPNPFRDRALIVFGQVLAEVTVYIHTNDGHEVARLIGTNTNLLYWDSRTAGIHARSPGLYYVTAVWADERGMIRRKTLAVQKRK